MPQKKN